MSSIATVTFNGESGKAYKLEAYNFDTSFNQVAAVYVVSRRYKNTNGGYSHDVIYIGQTENLQERFANHHKTNCFRNNNANAICVLQEGSEQVRLNIESDLVRNYKPPCNG